LVVSETMQFSVDFLSERQLTGSSLRLDDFNTLKNIRSNFIQIEKIYAVFQM